jgi:hypothetical protein
VKKVMDIHELQLREAWIPMCCSIYRSWICKKVLKKNQVSDIFESVTVTEVSSDSNRGQQ